MDTISQALLGAVVGQAGFSHRLGRRAVLWGAVGGVIPDLDVLAVAVAGPLAELRYHRGVTHALWFGPLVGPPLGWLVWRWQRWRRRRDPGPLSAWVGLFGLALFTHPLIDVFTAYGTQLFAPFSAERIAWNALGIIDPFYTGWLVAGLALGFLWRRDPARARAAGFAALAFSWSYMLYGTWLNQEAEARVREALAADGRPEALVRVYPTLLQPYLRRVVARSGGDLFVGLYTPLGHNELALEHFPEQHHPLIDALAATSEGALFTWFAMREVTGRVRQQGGDFVVEIDDLRYGLPDRPDEGMWGLRAVFDGSGRLRAPAVRFSRGRGGERVGVRALWAAMWGDFAALGLRTSAR